MDTAYVNLKFMDTAYEGFIIFIESIRTYETLMINENPAVDEDLSMKLWQLMDTASEILQFMDTVYGDLTIHGHCNHEIFLCLEIIWHYDNGL